MFELTAALIVFLFPLAYSPGPGNMFFAANGARFGPAATVPASLGYHVATLLVTLAIGFGFETTLERSPIVFQAIKWAGSAYVLYLAWKLFRASAIDTVGEARPAGVWGGAVLLLLNPKAYVIIALMFSQFLEAAAASGKLLAVGWISSVFTLNNLLAFTLWTLLGGQIAALFRDEARAHLLNRVFGSVLALVALWMMFG
ncbi:LysE family translocator [Henriciella aquimarina]|uniref:LysE family translocator n=1 Tax=Henriciella aquimarina TaxID=545261 RepID=UPI0009FBBE13|nr:LysE family translocator [Henriciella aquimarina]